MSDFYQQVFKEFPLAEEIWNKKYRFGDETINSTWARVAKAISSAEKTPELALHWYNEFYYILSEGYLIPGGRITNGAGTKNNYLLNCFAIRVPDDIEGIMDAVKKTAIIAKKNGGSGFSLHELRPKNAKLSAGGTSSGAVSFLDIFDACGKTIKSGGANRRAAQLATLPCFSPDIEEFIDAKREPGRLENFNISVGITKDFIRAVKLDLDWDLHWNNVVYKTVKAKYLWDKLVYSGYHYNDPGLLMLDEINEKNNSYYYEKIHTTNPLTCGGFLQ